MLAMDQEEQKFGALIHKLQQYIMCMYRNHILQQRTINAQWLPHKLIIVNTILLFLKNILMQCKAALCQLEIHFSVMH